MATKQQIILFVGFGYSGKAAKIRTLTPTECDATSLEAAKTSSANAADYRLTHVHLGVCRMLVAVTRDEVPFVPKPVLNGAGEPVIDGETKEPKVAHVPDENWLDDAANWVTVDPLAIAVPGGYERWIDNPKDDDLLGRIWSSLHEAGPGDIDRIMGKARRVSTG